MKNFFTTILAAATAAVSHADLIVIPPVTSTGTDVAIVWIQAKDISNSAYLTLAAQVQAQGAAKGQRIWIGLPEFPSNTPDSTLIDSQVASTLAELRSQGFTGDKVVMAGHSQGGFVSQGYTKSNSATIKAQVLMGSFLTRDQREINSFGATQINYEVPTLTIGGTKDGIARISRIAESFWHQHENIESDQAYIFPVVAFEGVSNAQFMSGQPSDYIKQQDLKPDVTEEAAHTMTATTVVQYFDQILFGKAPSINISASKTVLKGLLDAMVMEGYYNLKRPCDYSPTLVNPPDATCLHGAPWHNSYTQIVMGGTLPGTNMKISNDDNFHPVDQTNPVHLSEIDSDCTIDSYGCAMKTITVSQNIYDTNDLGDTGYYPQAASEMKTKLSSRQKIQFHAGVANPDFHELDEVGNRCAEINNASIQWAYARLSANAKANYDAYGQKLVTGDDMGPYNAGPLWIWTLMAYTPSADGSEMIIGSPMMRTPIDYLIQAAAGFHYCKVFSPFKAMEWMMNDGIFAKNGIKDTSAQLFLQ